MRPLRDDLPLSGVRLYSPSPAVLVRPFLVACLILLAGCDALEDAPRQPLVVEAFFVPGEPLPIIRVARAAELAIGSPVAVDDADRVEVAFEGRTVVYVWAGEGYVPQAADTVRSGVTYHVSVASGRDLATATARVPPRLLLSDLTLTPLDTTVHAVLLDTLRFDTTATGAREALVYPVLVDAAWATAVSTLPNWIRISVLPSRPIGSEIVSFFFPGEVVAPESAFQRGDASAWSGGYAVPVDSVSGGRPAHRVKVSVVRSEEAYARFVGSADAPERREPVGNVTGGRGLVVGLSLDSIVVSLPAFVPNAAPPP